MKSTPIADYSQNLISLKSGNRLCWKRSENSSSPIVSSNNRLTLAQTRLEEILAEEAIAFSQYNQLCKEKASLLNQVKTDKTINLEPEEKSINQEIERVLQVIHQLKVERTQAQVKIEHFFIQFKSNLFEFL